MIMALAGRVLVVCRFSNFGGYHVQISMSHAALGGEAVSQCANIVNSSAQNRYLQATFMVQMDVHGGYRKVMAMMLGMCEPLRQLPRFVVIDIAHCGDASCLIGFRKPLATDRFTAQVAQRLGTASIAAPYHQFIKRFQQVVIYGNSDSLHLSPPFLAQRPYQMSPLDDRAAIGRGEISS
jgi:hypothetical protein